MVLDHQPKQTLLESPDGERSVELRTGRTVSGMPEAVEAGEDEKLLPTQRLPQPRLASGAELTAGTADIYCETSL